MDIIEVHEALITTPTPDCLTISEFRFEYIESVRGPVCRVLGVLGFDRINLTPIENYAFNEIEELFTTEECLNVQLYLSDSLQRLNLHAALETIEIEDYKPRWKKDPDTWIRV